MKEREQILAEGKMDRNIGRLMHGLMWAQAVSSTGAILSVIPLEFFNVLSTPQELAMAIGGMLVAPGSIQSIRVSKKWLSHADKVIADFEKQTIDTSTNKVA